MLPSSKQVASSCSAAHDLEGVLASDPNVARLIRIRPRGFSAQLLSVQPPGKVRKRGTFMVKTSYDRMTATDFVIRAARAVRITPDILFP